jgi:signal transduction histidine kinase
MVLREKGNEAVPTPHTMNEHELKQLRDAFRKLSHDVRSPLTSIRGLAEITLEDPSLSDDARENLRLLVADAERLTDMTITAVDDIDARLSALHFDQE